MEYTFSSFVHVSEYKLSLYKIIIIILTLQGIQWDWISKLPITKSLTNPFPAPVPHLLFSALFWDAAKRKDRIQIGIIACQLKWNVLIIYPSNFPFCFYLFIYLSIVYLLSAYDVLGTVWWMESIKNSASVTGWDHRIRLCDFCSGIFFIAHVCNKEN